MNNRAPDPEPTGPAGSLHLSNLLTYAALMSGCAAAAFGIMHQRSAAGVFIAVAVIADTFDGRFAGLFARTRFQSAYGVQIDSLADAVTSGFVPVIVLASDSVPMSRGAALAWWSCAFLYSFAAITRLGYYNLKHGDGPGFVGVPAPMCALVISTSLLWSPSPWAAALILLGCAVAMVAPIRVPRPRSVGFAAWVGWAMLVLLLHARAF